MVFAFLRPNVIVNPESASPARHGVHLKACVTSHQKGNAAISARNVNFVWPNGRRALTDININVHPGELAMIVGRNGCGKSTLLSVLCGVILADSGTIDVATPCSVIRQDPSLQILAPTVGRDIILSIPDVEKRSKEEIRQEVDEVMELVGLTPSSNFFDTSSYRLSGGQQQRAVLAAALASRPRTILFDEVTALVDPVSRADILDKVRVLVTSFNIAALW